MNKKRAVIAVTWTYSCWVMGGVVEFFIGTPAILGLALGIAGAVFFGLDPLGIVWPKPEPADVTDAPPISVESSPAIGDVSAQV